MIHMLYFLEPIQKQFMITRLPHAKSSFLSLWTKETFLALFLAITGVVGFLYSVQMGM